MPLSLPTTALRHDYDVVVIGSGYGGSIAAARLASARRPDGSRPRVCVLERGREQRPGEFPRTPREAAAQLQASVGKQHVRRRDALYWLHAGKDVSVLHGCGLGGTSLINAGVAMEPERRVFADPCWPRAFGDDLDRGLADGFARAREMLGVQTHPNPARLPKYRALQRSARRLDPGGRATPAPLTIEFGQQGQGGHRACHGCGECVAGCNHGAKKTLATTYLPMAQRAGAELFCRVDVRRVEAQDGGFRVYYEPLDQHRARLGGDEAWLRAGLVVLAAGVMGTCEILTRSRAAGLPCSERLGERFSGNGDLLGFAHGGDEQVRGVGLGRREAVEGSLEAPGPCISGVIDRRADRPLSEAHLIQEGVIPAALLGALSGPLGLGARLQRLAQQHGPRPSGRDQFLGAALQRTQTLLLMGHDPADGRLVMQGDEVTVRWPGAASARLANMHAQLRVASEALNATYVPAQPLPVGAGRGTGLITVHPLGGCAMSEDGSSGVTNHAGQLYAGADERVHENLYVMDASVLPRSLGVNPLLTISAIAERNVSLLAQRLGWSLASPRSEARGELPIAARPAALARRDPLPVQFTERMSGRVAPCADGGASSSDGALGPTRFVGTVCVPDVRSIAADPAATGRIVGTVEIPWLGAEPMGIARGEFTMFASRDGRRDAGRMRYRMSLRATDGRCYFLDGHKKLERGRRGLWGDTTRLFVVLYAGQDAGGHVIGRGELRITASSFLRELTTLRATDADGRASVRGLALYGTTFMQTLWNVYGPRAPRRPRSARRLPRGQT